MPPLFGGLNMKYYKMIQDNEIIGAISSNNFIYYQPVTDCFLQCDEEKGEYITYKGKRYRSAWMSPIKMQLNYTEVTLLEIPEEEYHIYEQAIKNNETIVIVEEDEIEEIIDEPDISVEFVKESKLKEMSYQCRTTIEAGFDLELRGETKHFSLDTQDQLNLMSLSMLAQTQETIPYHADGEICEFYTAAEINDIVAEANAFKMYQTTYFNALKAYINSLDDAAAIIAIKYGDEIPEEFKTDVLKALEGE